MIGFAPGYGRSRWMLFLFDNSLPAPPASTKGFDWILPVASTLGKYYLFLFIGKINNAKPPVSITIGPTIWGNTGPPYVNRTYPITVPKPIRTYPLIFLIIFHLSHIHIYVDLPNDGFCLDLYLSSMHLLNKL
jgi:hypothetical protein